MKFRTTDRSVTRRRQELEPQVEDGQEILFEYETVSPELRVMLEQEAEAWWDLIGPKTPIDQIIQYQAFFSGLGRPRVLEISKAKAVAEVFKNSVYKDAWEITNHNIFIEIFDRIGDLIRLNPALRSEFQAYLDSHVGFFEDRLRQPPDPAILKEYCPRGMFLYPQRRAEILAQQQKWAPQHVRYIQGQFQQHRGGSNFVEVDLPFLKNAARNRLAAPHFAQDYCKVVAPYVEAFLRPITLQELRGEKRYEFIAVYASLMALSAETVELNEEGLVVMTPMKEKPKTAVNLPARATF